MLGGQQREVVIVLGIDRRGDSMDACFVEQRIHDRADCLGGVSAALCVGDDRIPDGRLPPAVTDGNRDVADRPTSSSTANCPGIVRGAIDVEASSA